MSLYILWAALFPPMSRSEYILHVPSTEECPKYTKRIDENYCKPLVSNKFTGSTFSGRCPSGSGNVGYGYCMYAPEFK